MLSIKSDMGGFKVERCEPELVVPSKATPHEYKQVSDIDDQEGFRCHIHMIQLYHHNPNMDGIDPVKVIKKAISDTLVYYYPFAGRLKEGPGKKLFVECNGEGILFIEANAKNLILNQLIHNSLQPPFPYIDQLHYDVPTSVGVLDSPLLLIQVTRLMCGGFIFALSYHHAITDGYGTFQFMKAVAEMARGALTPSILPVWQRALFNATDPPRVTHVHHEYDQQLVHTNVNTITPLDHMAHRSFFFGSTEISAIRKTVPSNTTHFSSFVVLSAYMWRLRTKILNLNSEEEVRCICVVNLRSKRNGLPLGYYGNAIALCTAITTAGKLCENPLSYAIELVGKAEENVSEEYLKSVASFMVSNGRPRYSTIGSYVAVDFTSIEFDEVDFGWGKAIYGGPAAGEPPMLTNLSSYFISFENQQRSEKGVLVSICLTTSAMEQFVVEFDALSNNTK